MAVRHSLHRCYLSQSDYSLEQNSRTERSRHGLTSQPSPCSACREDCSADGHAPRALVDGITPASEDDLGVTRKLKSQAAAVRTRRCRAAVAREERHHGVTWIGRDEGQFPVPDRPLVADPLLKGGGAVYADLGPVAGTPVSYLHHP